MNPDLVLQAIIALAEATREVATVVRLSIEGQTIVQRNAMWQRYIDDSEPIHKAWMHVTSLLMPPVQPKEQTNA